MIILCLVGFFTVNQKAQANPSFFPVTTYLDGLTSATGTPKFMTPGLATSTLTYDTYTNGNPLKTDSAVLLTRFAASSTNAILNINVEYSYDGIDYYKDSLTSFMGTSTPFLTNIAPVNSFAWQFASSTVGVNPLTAVTGATSTKAINIVTPTRYVRVVYSLTGAGANIWAQMVPAKQKPE